jgi:hypothetical protein
MKYLKEIDFHYNGVDCEYYYHNDCHNYGCEEEGICRCGTIVDQEIEKVDIKKITDIIYNLYFGENTLSNIRENKLKTILYGTGKDLDIYTIDRILRKFKIWEEYIWEINVVGGYYGEELDSIKMSDNICKRIEDELEIAFSIDELNGRVEYLLGLEYGSLLPELEDCNYEIVDINKSDIIFGSENHYDKVKKKDLTHYNDNNYDGIRGVVLEKDGRLRVIDGYHRIHTTNGTSVRVFKAIKKELD